jgi:hypothetical protein
MKPIALACLGSLVSRLPVAISDRVTGSHGLVVAVFLDSSVSRSLVGQAIRFDGHPASTVPRYQGAPVN